MVHVEQQQVLLRGQAQQLRAQQRTRLEVEGLTRVCVGDLARARLTLGLRHRTEIGDRQRHRTRRLDHLHGLRPHSGQSACAASRGAHQLIEAAL